MCAIGPYCIFVLEQRQKANLCCVTLNPCCALPLCLQVLLARMAGKLAGALQQEHAAAAAWVLSSAAASVSAPLPPLPADARQDIAGAVLASGRHRKLIKSALHAIVAGSSRCVACRRADSTCQKYVAAIALPKARSHFSLSSLCAAALAMHLPQVNACSVALCWLTSQLQLAATHARSLPDSEVPP